MGKRLRRGVEQRECMRIIGAEVSGCKAEMCGNDNCCPSQSVRLFTSILSYIHVALSSLMRYLSNSFASASFGKDSVNSITGVFWIRALRLMHIHTAIQYCSKASPAPIPLHRDNQHASRLDSFICDIARPHCYELTAGDKRTPFPRKLHPFHVDHLNHTVTSCCDIPS